MLLVRAFAMFEFSIKRRIMPGNIGGVSEPEKVGFLQGFESLECG